MQHTIAAVFDKQSQAQHARDDLVASGFSPNDIRLSQNETPDQTGQATTSRSHDDDSFGSGIRSFFAEIFGSSSRDDAELYSEAVLHGNYVLTVNVPDDDLVDRATDVLDRYDPVDIDEQASNWKSGGWAAAESMRSDTTTGQYAGQQPYTDQEFADKQSMRQTERQAGSESKAIPVIQEELKIGKREVQRGGVRVYQRVVDTPVQENVNLREERVTVERHAVDQPASAADLSALKEQSFEVRETAEEPVIEKVARVVEEVVVGKEVQQRQEQVSDTVRSTQVEIEQLSPGTSQYGTLDDDSYYRNHWNSNYASTGGSYDDYAPAYRYGSTMASNDQYRGRRWDEIEPTLRSDWETRNPGSPWEKTKAAIRHGWDRMTGQSQSQFQSGTLDDDSYYRNHWNSNYASTGGSYDDYAPAYRYGSTLASSDQYRGRRWDEVEPTIRSDWEARNPGSPWEKTKAAIRHGWDRMTK
jgi:uncharacterized protein (TIGR02271 family)